MAATVVWENSTAGAASWSTVTQIRFKNANDATIDLNNPMVKPPSSVDYSFEKALRINATAAPSNQISNVRYYFNGSETTGIDSYHKFASSYTQPVEVDGTSILTYTNTANSTYYSWTGSGTFTGTGQIGQLLYLCITVGTSVSSGLQNINSSGNVQAVWDEI